MKDEPKLIIKNSQPKSSSLCYSPQKDSFTLPMISSSNCNTSTFSDVSQRLKKLQGNLKILEKQYRANLKQGFDNKIKAYRLQAVVERKLFKEALSSIKKSKERESLQQKLNNSRANSLYESRVEIMKVDRENREKLFKQKLKQEKRGYSLSLYEKRVEDRQNARKSHDKITQQEQHVNVKRDYFIQLRKEQHKKKEEQLKGMLLQKIFNNTQKLRELKTTLETLKESEVKAEKTFLTI